MKLIDRVGKSERISNSFDDLWFQNSAPKIAASNLKFQILDDIRN
jgi:hypothetical protein